MHIDWPSLDELIATTAYYPAYLNTRSGAFGSGHVDAGTPREGDLESGSAGMVATGWCIDPSRFNRGVLQNIGDPVLRIQALEALQSASHTSVLRDLPSCSSSERREDQRRRKLVLGELLSHDPAVRALWAAESMDVAARLDMWTRLEQLRIPIDNPPPWLEADLAFLRAYASRWQDVLRAQLDAIDTWINMNAPDRRSSLREGASEGTLLEVENVLGHRLPAALGTLWQWHDGSDDVLFNFLDGMQILSDAAAVRQRGMLNGLLRDGHFDDRGDLWWRPAWLPVFTSLGADAYCVDLVEKHVVSFLHDDSPRLRLFPDIDKLIDTFADELAEGVWTYRPQVGIVAIDDEEAIKRRTWGPTDLAAPEGKQGP